MTPLVYSRFSCLLFIVEVGDIWKSVVSVVVLTMHSFETATVQLL